VLLRLDLDLWRYDLDAELDVSDGETFNFETGTAGSPVDSLYLSRDLALSAEGSVTAATSVWGALPVDSLGAAVVAGATNALTLQLGAEIDALSFRLLDPDGAYTLPFKRGGVSASGLSFGVHAANNRLAPRLANNRIVTDRRMVHPLGWPTLSLKSA
jgi:hypothetical protein